MFWDVLSSNFKFFLHCVKSHSVKKEFQKIQSDGFVPEIMKKQGGFYQLKQALVTHKI